MAVVSLFKRVLVTGLVLGVIRTGVGQRIDVPCTRRICAKTRDSCAGTHFGEKIEFSKLSINFFQRRLQSFSDIRTAITLQAEAVEPTERFIQAKCI